MKTTVKFLRVSDNFIQNVECNFRDFNFDARKINSQASDLYHDHYYCKKLKNNSTATTSATGALSVNERNNISEI